MTGQLDTAELVAPRRESRATVLIVEDDSAMRLLLEIYLSSFGYDVLLAENGDAALGMAASRPDIRAMVMDVVMSGLSGQQLAEAIKGALPGICILFCSGHPAKALTSYGIDLAAGNFLQKPCRPADLKRKMEELLASN